MTGKCQFFLSTRSFFPSGKTCHGKHARVEQALISNRGQERIHLKILSPSISSRWKSLNCSKTEIQSETSDDIHNESPSIYHYRRHLPPGAESLATGGMTICLRTWYSVGLSKCRVQCWPNHLVTTHFLLHKRKSVEGNDEKNVLIISSLKKSILIRHKRSEHSAPTLSPFE